MSSRCSVTFPKQIVASVPLRPQHRAVVPAGSAAELTPVMSETPVSGDVAHRSGELTPVMSETPVSGDVAHRSGSWNTYCEFDSQ